jgi:hypothetical protein
MHNSFGKRNSFLVHPKFVDNKQKCMKVIDAKEEIN